MTDIYRTLSLFYVGVGNVCHSFRQQNILWCNYLFQCVLKFLPIYIFTCWSSHDYHLVRSIYRAVEIIIIHSSCPPTFTFTLCHCKYLTVYCLIHETLTEYIVVHCKSCKHMIKVCNTTPTIVVIGAHKLHSVWRKTRENVSVQFRIGDWESRYNNDKSGKEKGMQGM